MRFYTKQECEEWLKARQRVKPDEVEGARFERVSFPPEAQRFYYFAHWIATELTYREPALLWITEWGIWPLPAALARVFQP